MTVKRYVDEYRKKNHLSPSKFAEIMGIKETELSKLERKLKNPDTRLLYEVSDAMDIPMDILSDPQALERYGIQRRRTVYNIGLHTLFENVQDFKGFCYFLEAIHAACELITGEEGVTALFFQKRLPDELGFDFIKDSTPAHVDFILERYQVKLSMPKGVYKKLSEESIKHVKPAGYFNNEVYGFRFVEKGGSVFELHLGIRYK